MKNTLRFPAVWLWALLLTPTVFGRDLYFRHYGVEDGLSGSTCLCLLQDRQGFIWVGTRQGLSRFDGYRWTVFRNDPRDPSSIAGNYVLSLFEDRDGRIWVGTYDAGMECLDPSTGRCSHFGPSRGRAAGEALSYSRATLQDRQGALWFGSGDTLARLDRATGAVTRYRHAPGVPGSLGPGEIWDLEEDVFGRLWIATAESGVSILEPGKPAFRRLGAASGGEPGLSCNFIRDIRRGPDGSMWLGADNGDVDRVSPDARTIRRYPRPPRIGGGRPNSSVMAVLPDSRGRVWVGTYDEGLFRLNPETGVYEESYASSPLDPGSLSFNEIWDLLEDRQGLIWVAMDVGGVNCCNPAVSFRVFRHNPQVSSSLGGDPVTSFCQTAGGDVWIGTYGGGVSRWVSPERGFETFRAGGRPGSLAHDVVRGLFADRRGRVWVGTDRGIDIREGDRWARHIELPRSTVSGLPCLPVRFLEDRRGRIWLGTHGGGLKLLDDQGNVVRSFLPVAGDETSLSHAEVRVLAEDRSGGIWVGTLGGLNRLDPDTGRFTRYLHDPSNPDSLGGNIVYGILPEASGAVWVTCDGGGLNRFDPGTGKFRHWDEHEGLPSNSIFGILPDGRGNLWMSSNRGLCRFNPADGSVLTFDARDGLPSDEFNQTGFLRLADGDMVFGTVRGFVRFNPDQLRGNPTPPPVILTDFRVFDRSVPQDSELYPDPSRGDLPLIRLSYRENFFSFEFAALNFINPERNRFAYRLEGFDPDWIRCGNRRLASYTNLDPGEYVFRVKACNNNGVWNEAGLAVRVRISPPPWRTWWAYAGYAIVCGLLLHLYIRARLRAQANRAEREMLRMSNEHLKEVDALKTGFLNMVSHDMRTPLTSIVGFAGLLRKRARMAAKPPPGDEGRGVAAFARRVEENAGIIVAEGERLVRLINDLLDLARIEAGKLDLHPGALSPRELALDAFRVSGPLLAQKGLEGVLDVPDDLPPVRADRERTSQVLTNLVSNAVKFTERGSVTLRARLDGDFVVFSVEDTGIGLKPEDLEKIFEKFGQVEPGRKTFIQGTGLGLSICRQLVEMQGGRIRVESREGQGSVFSFTLPRAARKGGDGGPAEKPLQPTE